MKKLLTTISCIAFTLGVYAQNKNTLPYYEIPDATETYTAETVASRLIDGLGFRYYWATQGLRPEDLAFKPNDTARSSEETIDHIYDLCAVIYNTVMGKPNEGASDVKELTFEQKRTKTLKMLKEASDKLRSGNAGTVANSKIIFKRGESSTEYPFWNLINGPIADAIWHCGQVVSFRRSSGNPFTSKVSVFSGKVRQ
jgi:hypothetical protein